MRSYTVKTPFRRWLYLFFFSQQISESVKERLLKFHEKAGLVFAAYDFLDLGDDVIFLECNACRAAWLWLQMAVGINVSENVARYLLGKEETDASWAMDSVKIVINCFDFGLTILNWKLLCNPWLIYEVPI